MTFSWIVNACGADDERPSPNSAPIAKGKCRGAALFAWRRSSPRDCPSLQLVNAISFARTYTHLFWSGFGRSVAGSGRAPFVFEDAQVVVSLPCPERDPTVVKVFYGSARPYLGFGRSTCGSVSHRPVIRFIGASPPPPDRRPGADFARARVAVQQHSTSLSCVEPLVTAARRDSNCDGANSLVC